ncbi:MAG TPA: leucine-rich repeat domain-containing protein [Saprospiraceae bacterium]|nr:leucine-rich repeat domain-containing protein [Saprospiraceae bacterium]
MSWWNDLPPYWKTAFNEAVLGKGAGYVPDEADLQKIHLSPALRFAGPRAPYPNMRVELPNLAGLEGLKNVEILVVTHHQIGDLRGLEQLTRLKSLFLFNNRITRLNGVEKMTRLEELFFQHNEVGSLEPLRGLTSLKKVYCSNNKLTSFEGITAAHSTSLKDFYCLPNDDLAQKEIIRLENRLGIRCVRG